MKIFQRVWGLLWLMILAMQADASNIDSLGIVWLSLGNNIPVQYTSGSSTTITKVDIFRYSDTSCGTLTGQSAWENGSYNLPAAPTTIYFSTNDGAGSLNLAKTLCPSGTTSGSASLLRINFPDCTVTATGCFTATCSGTGQVTSISGTYPQFTCP